MTYTRHGWHIDGTTLEDRPIGLLTAKCGGPQACKECEDDTTTALLPDVLEILDEANKTQKVYYTKETIDRLYEVLNKSKILDMDQTYKVIDALQESGVVTELQVTHNQDTMSKVYSSLARAGLSHQQLIDVVNDMQNQGILFREGIKKS